MKLRHVSACVSFPDLESCIVDVTPTTVEMLNCRAAEESNIQYSFDACYGEKSQQEEIFDAEVKPLLSCPLKGRNASCFAFGPTGSGKDLTPAYHPRFPEDHWDHQ